MGMGSREDTRYVRFGWPPKGGRSKNHIAATTERGTSAYEGELIEPELFRINTGGLTLSGLQGLIARAAQDAPAFFVAGEEVGVGADGEPLLRVADVRRVPRSTSVTSVDSACRPALKLWSTGPRDFSGRHKAPRRVQSAEYSPELRFSAAVVGSFYEPAAHPFGPPLKRSGRR